MQRAPRTPESYFNVPESIALLNIVKSDRIQSAFQSNRKNHASVWEMVANILSRYSSRKRSAKQCCNRYENLKKIYTQLKRNPEKHVRRNWPYMYLFREIEEQRGECWGSNSKRNKSELSYYQRRRALMLMNKEAISNDNDRLAPNNFVETEIAECDPLDGCADGNLQHADGIVFGLGTAFKIKEEPADQDYDQENENTYINNNYNGNQSMYINGQNEPNILHPDVIVDTDHVTDSSSISLGSKRKTSTSTDAESTNYELIEYLKRREKRDEEMFRRMEEREERLINLLERTVVAIEHIASHNHNHKSNHK